MYRVWSKHPHCSPEFLTLLWEDYRQKKKKVADKVKQNIVKRKLMVITKNASKVSKNPKAFWNKLGKFNKTNNYQLCMRHPDHPELIIDDPLMIKKTLTAILV